MGTIAFLFVFLCVVKQKQTHMKTKASIILLFSCIILASCGKSQILELPIVEEQEQLSSQDTQEKKAAASVQQEACAYVRIGMCETIEGYDITVTDMWIEAEDESFGLPRFGMNLLDCAHISSSFANPTFDNADGGYNIVQLNGTGTDLTIHFNMEMSCKDGSAPIIFEDVTFSIENVSWKNKCTYSYVVTVYAQMLDLSAINFNPEASDYEEVM